MCELVKKLRAAAVLSSAGSSPIADSQSITSAALDGRFTYMTVSDYRTISQRLAPALDHLFNHQTHHRGQAHTILTSLGQASVQLDLIAFQRTEEGRLYA